MATNKCRDFTKQPLSTSKLAAIFFDMDNTLIPTRKGDSKACRKLGEILIEKHGLSHEQAENVTKTFLQSFRSCPDNPQTTLDSWRSYLWSQALPDNLKHLNETIYKTWLQLRYRYLALTSDYDNLLKRLGKQFLLGLITNGPSNAQWEKINKLNLSHYFDCILVSSDLPWEKPNPNIFLAACNFLNVKPQQCIMIGDKLETDIQGGKAAKLGGTIWIPLNPENIDDVKPTPDLIIQNLCEILKYFNISSDSNENCLRPPRRHSQTPSSSTSTMSSTSSSSSSSTSRKSQQYRRVVSLPEIDLNSDNSSDGS